MGAEFVGFPHESVEFFEQLAHNNSKEWFKKNKPDYDKYVMEPAKEFVVDMGNKLRKLRPDIFALPKMNGSIFRIYRDVRFSKDKTPYKTNLGMLFWEGPMPRKENPGLYIHIAPPILFVAVGLHIFNKPMLAQYRDSVSDDKTGEQLQEILLQIGDNGYEVGGDRYKRVPREFDKDHPRADLLLYKGIYAFRETPITDDFYTPEFSDTTTKTFVDLLDLHVWLVGTAIKAKSNL